LIVAIEALLSGRRGIAWFLAKAKCSHERSSKRFTSSTAFSAILASHCWGEGEAASLHLELEKI
jgi:hypothetical protein